MAKKIKTFTVDVGAYDALVALFKESKIEASVSSCLDRYIKEMLDYLRAIKDGLTESAAYTVPFSFIMEAAANLPKFKELVKEPITGETKSSLMAELDEWQRLYDEKTSEGVKLTVDPKAYGQISEAAKRYGVKDVMAFFFKVMLEQAKRGRELKDDEYRTLVKSMGEGFDEYRKGKVLPVFDKVDNTLDKALKPFGLRIDREEDKK